MGHGSPGIPALASSWFFAAGATGPTFEFSLTLVNPSASAAAVRARYRLPSGELVTRDHLVPPTGRAVIVVNQEDTRLANATLSVSLESTNGVEFAAERTLRWRAPTTEAGQEAHYGAGAPATATDWGFAEGEVGGGADTDTLLTINNPAPIAATARVTLLFEDGSTVAKVLDLGASSRSTLSIATAFPTAAEKRFSVLVQSLGDSPARLTVEWSMYSRVNGSQFLPVMDAMATPLQNPPSMNGTTADDRIVANATAATAAMQSAAEAQLPAATSDAAVTVTTVPAVSTPGAAVFNLQVVSDASPDLADLKRFVDSTTSRWSTSREKVWALFYWGHILKRQTGPIVLHGSEVTDPIRNFSDYGFTMCSTITGINQSLYEAIGLKHQYWDICNHTVSAVEYDGKFHMVDTSMSNLVTEDDGVTLATVEEAAAESARLVRERSLYATSPNGFLTGTDTMRNLGSLVNPGNGSVLGGFAADFCAANLKYRDYYYNWNSGHRYVLNLREDESYTRYYAPLGSSSDYWVGSESVSAPDPAQTFENDASHRFGMRGNGRWTFTPSLTPGEWARAAYRYTNITAGAAGGLHPGVAAQAAEVIYKVQAANAITSQSIQAQFARTDPRLPQRSRSVSITARRGPSSPRLAPPSAPPSALRQRAHRGERRLRDARAYPIDDRQRNSGRRDPDRPGNPDDHAGEHQGAAEAECRPQRNLRHAQRPVGHDGSLARPQGRLLEKGCLRLEQHRVAAGVDSSTVHGSCLPRGAHDGCVSHVSIPGAHRHQPPGLWRPASQLPDGVVYRLPALVRQRRDLDPLVPAHRREQAVRRDSLRDRHRDPARRSHRSIQVPDSQHEYARPRAPPACTRCAWRWITAR